MAGVRAMSSLLVWIKPDAPTNWRQHVRGDVVDVSADDAMNWGADVQGPSALGWWRVIVLPGVPFELVAGLVSADPADMNNPDKPRRIRLHTLDLNAFDSGPNTYEHLMACVSMKPTITDQNVIGDDPNVIG